MSFCKKQMSRESNSFTKLLTKHSPKICMVNRLERVLRREQRKRFFYPRFFARLWKSPICLGSWPTKRENTWTDKTESRSPVPDTKRMGMTRDVPRLRLVTVSLGLDSSRGRTWLREGRERETRGRQEIGSGWRRGDEPEWMDGVVKRGFGDGTIGLIRSKGMSGRRYSFH